MPPAGTGSHDHEMQSEAEFQQCAERFKALSDPARLQIVLCLFEGDRNVGEIADLVGHDMVKVSHHLGVLRHADIVTTQREGRFVKYRLHPTIVLHTAGHDTARSIEFGCCRVDLSKAFPGENTEQTEQEK